MKKIILAMLISTTAIAAGFKYSGIKHDITTTASSGGTTTLTSASNQVRQITGALTHTVVLPAANTLSAGYWYTVSNDSTGAVTVQNNGLSTLATLSSGQTATFYVVDASTANGVWDVQSGGITELTGDVTAGPGNGSQVATIANLAVTNAKIANSTIDLTTKVTGQLPNANLADMVQSTVKGRAAGAGTGTPTDLSDAQLAVILDSYFVANTGSESVSGVKTFNDESLFKKGLDLEETGAGTNRVRVRANDSSSTWDLILPSVFPTSDTMVLGITSLDSVNNYAYTSFETPSGGGGGGWFVAASIASNTSNNATLGISDVTSYTGFGHSSLQLTAKSGSTSVQIPCAGTTAPSGTTCSGADEQIGVAFTPPTSGYAKACAHFSHKINNSSSDVSSTFQFVLTANNSQTITEEGGGRVNVFGNVNNNQNYPVTTCGIFNLTSGSQIAIRLFYEQDTTGTPSNSEVITDASTASGQRDVFITVEPI